MRKGGSHSDYAITFKDHQFGVHIAQKLGLKTKA